MLRVFVILCVFLYSFCAQAQSLTYLAISAQAEPFQIIAQPNKGIVTDILDQAVQKLDITLTEQAYPFMRYLRMMHTDHNPLWISYGSPAWQGDSEISIQSRHLSKEKLFDVTHVLVVKADRNFNFYSIEALFGETVFSMIPKEDEDKVLEILQKYSDGIVIKSELDENGARLLYN